MTRKATATGCTVLFLLPFCAVGVWAAVNAIGEALAGNWRDAGLFSIFALAFGGAGFGLLAAYFHGLERRRQRERRQQRHPDQPWLWRPEWAGGRVEDRSGREVLFAWGFAAFWNVISLPLAFVAVRDELLRKGNHVALLVLVFPLVGLGLLIWAVRATLRRRKFGVSVFRMAKIPGTIGRALRGVIITATRVRADDGFLLTLSCINRVTTGSGRNRSTRERILWQAERQVTHTPSVTAGATAIPVAFRLPVDARETDDSDSADEILWRLEVEADVPGIDYRARFEVPVFRTEESDTPLTPEDEAALQLSDEEIFRQSPDSRIYVTSALTRTEIFFAPARNVGAALSLTIFFALWAGITVGLPFLGAPLLFPIVFGLFALLMLWVVVDLWLGTTRVVASAAGLEITSGLLGIGRTRSVATDQIAEIDLKIRMQMGKRPYYDIIVRTRSGKRIPAGRVIRDKAEADWLVERIRFALEGR